MKRGRGATFHHSGFVRLKEKLFMFCQPDETTIAKCSSFPLLCVFAKEGARVVSCQRKISLCSLSFSFFRYVFRLSNCSQVPFYCCTVWFLCYHLEHFYLTSHSNYVHTSCHQRHSHNICSMLPFWHFIHLHVMSVTKVNLCM